MRLPEVEHFAAVSIGEVIGETKRGRVVATAAAVAPADPGSGSRAAVVAEPQTLGDFHEIGRAPHRQLRAGAAAFERRLAR